MFQCSIHKNNFNPQCQYCKATEKKERTYNSKLPENFLCRDGNLFRKKNGKYRKSNVLEVILSRYMPSWYRRHGCYPEWW